MTDTYQIKDQYAPYFLTFQVVFWLDVFTRKEYRDVFLESLSYCRTNKKLEVFAYVIMYNHIHMIVRSDSGDLSGTIRDLKKFTSREIIKRISSGGESRKRWLLKEMAFAARKHCRNSSYQLWTHENHAVELTSNSIIDQRMDYIHRNPVKAGIVENAEDYLYSSARNYCDDYDALIEIDIML